MINHRPSHKTVLQGQSLFLGRLALCSGAIFIVSALSSVQSVPYTIASVVVSLSACIWTAMGSCLTRYIADTIEDKAGLFDYVWAIVLYIGGIAWCLAALAMYMVHIYFTSPGPVSLIAIPVATALALLFIPSIATVFYRYRT